jgi:hypothetical protein
MPADDRMRQHETYCTTCKENVPIADASYVKMANGRAIIKGNCSNCGLELIKASIMPKSSSLKLLRKKKRKGSKKGFPLI